MYKKAKEKAKELLLWSQKYTKTNMLYVAKGGFWLTLSQTVSSLASLLLAIAFANLIPPDVYGTYRYILSIAGIMAVATLPGINTGVIQATANGSDGTFTVGLKTKLRWSILSMLAGLFMASYYYIQENEVLALSFMIVAVFTPLMHSFALYDSYLQGKKEFEASAKYSILIQIASLVALLSAMIMTKNILVIILAYFIVWTSLRCVLFFITLKKVPQKSPVDLRAISYGKHLSLLSILSTAATYIDQMLIYHFLGPIQVAIYAVAIAPAEQLRALFRGIGNLALPKLAVKNGMEIRRAVIQKLKPVLCLVVILATCYFIAVPYFFEILFPKYEESIGLSKLSALSLLGIASYLTTAGITASRSVKELYTFSSIGSIAQIVASVALIPSFGIWGAVWAKIFGHIFNFLFSWYILVSRNK